MITFARFSLLTDSNNDTSPDKGGRETNIADSPNSPHTGGGGGGANVAAPTLSVEHAKEINIILNTASDTKALPNRRRDVMMNEASPAPPHQGEGGGGGHILPPLPYRVMIPLNLKTIILLRMKFIFPIQGQGQSLIQLPLLMTVALKNQGTKAM